MNRLTFKKLVLCAALLPSTLCAWSVLAADNPNYRGNQDGYDTFVGMGYKQYWVTPQGEWKRVLNGNTGGFALLAGQRIHPYFAIELGYEWSNGAPKIVSVPDGGAFLGSGNASGGPINLQGKVRFKTGYADLQILMPFKVTETCTPELIFALGVGIMKPSIKLASTAADPATQAAQAAFMAPFSTFKGKDKAVARVGLGMQTFLTESIGIRALWRFENTANLRGTNSAIAQDLNRRTLFKNGQSVFVGLVMRL